MHLINVSTLQLDWFLDVDQAPPYAILSHTWGKGEVTFQDFMSPDRDAVRALTGFRKIDLTCQQAARDGLTHAWVDTCCIDKTSSAELTEAINSMFTWYRTSAVCYAFLADISASDPFFAEADPDRDCSSAVSSALSRTRWVTRGWTLQELIAPRELRFYDNAWNLRGTKAGLSATISRITHIEEAVLRGEKALDSVPLMHRMAWAAGRRTTRAEDMAYCLLGIFGVNMPLLYGEGKRAFVRLQEEVMRESSDTSLFAWRAAPGGPAFRGILAESPAEFADAAELAVDPDPAMDEEFAVTNKGVKTPLKLEVKNDRPVLRLRCRFRGRLVGLFLRLHGAGVYVRADPDKLAVEGPESEWGTSGGRGFGDRPVYISKTLSPSQTAFVATMHRHGVRLRHGFDVPVGPHGAAGDLRAPFPPESLARVSVLYPEGQWDTERGMFLTGGKGPDGFVGVATMTLYDRLSALFLVVWLEGGTIHASFVDLVDPRTREIMPPKGRGGSDTAGLKKLAIESPITTFKDVELVVGKGMMEGEEVFCVDLLRVGSDHAALDYTDLSRRASRSLDGSDM